MSDVDSSKGKIGSSICLYKYTILFFLGLLHAARQFCNNIPIGLQDTIIKVMKVDNAWYGILHSAEYYPGVILPLLGGIAMDKLFGGKLYILPFMTGLRLLGQIAVATGAIMDIFWVMILARLLVGIADGIDINLLLTCKSTWFKEDLTIAMSIGYMWSRLGATMALTVSQPIYDSLDIIANQNVRLGLVISVGSILMTFALLGSIILVVMDEIGEKRGLVVKPKKKLKINFSDFKSFSVLFWAVFVPQALFYSFATNFVANGQLLYISKYNLSTNEAIVANAILYFGVVLINPFIGLLINTSQYHILWCIAGFVLSIGSNLLILCTSLMKPIPFIVGCINAVSYSFFTTAIWPIIPRIVEHHQLNTAYGIINCTWFSPVTALVVGIIIDNIGYIFQAIFYISLCTIGILSLLIMLVKVKDIRTVN